MYTSVIACFGIGSGDWRALAPVSAVIPESQEAGPFVCTRPYGRLLPGFDRRIVGPDTPMGRTKVGLPIRRGDRSPPSARVREKLSRATLLLGLSQREHATLRYNRGVLTHFCASHG